MDKAQRFAVLIPVIGWEADISSENLEHTGVKIANMSTGGAYLITAAEYQLGSRSTLQIKTSQMSFFVTAQVLRNDPFGVAVRFLDLCESDRSSILEIISRFLQREKPDTLILEETPAFVESHLELNCYF